jgi:hypothetical protein
VEHPRKYCRRDFKIYHNSGKSHDFGVQLLRMGTINIAILEWIKNKEDMSSMQYFTKRIII